MRKLFLVVAFLISGATFSMATSNVRIEDPKKKKSEVKPLAESCTVTVKSGNTTVTVTHSCSCTGFQACQGAYQRAVKALF
jgi:hypothetical protein